jgi:hypothetical protein
VRGYVMSRSAAGLWRVRPNGAPPQRAADREVEAGGAIISRRKTGVDRPEGGGRDEIQTRN